MPNKVRKTPRCAYGGPNPGSVRGRPASRDGRQYPGQNAARVGWAAGHGAVDGNDVRDGSGARVATAEDSAGAAAIADGDDELGVRRRVVRALQRQLHVARDGPRDEKQICVARARNEPNSQTFDVVEGVVQRVNLELAAVARAGVDLPHAEGAPERRED